MATHPTTESSKSYDNDYHKPHTVDDLTQRNVKKPLGQQSNVKANPKGRLD
jgi:hypothetical protein